MKGYYNSDKAILYVFDATPGQIPSVQQETAIIYVQQEDLAAWVEANSEYASIIKPYNYNTMTVQKPVWYDYIDQDIPDGPEPPQPTTYSLTISDPLSAIDNVWDNDTSSAIDPSAVEAGHDIQVNLKEGFTFDASATGTVVSAKVNGSSDFEYSGQSYVRFNMPEQDSTLDIIPGNITWNQWENISGVTDDLTRYLDQGHLYGEGYGYGSAEEVVSHGLTVYVEGTTYDEWAQFSDPTTLGFEQGTILYANTDNTANTVYAWYNGDTSNVDIFVATSLGLTSVYGIVPVYRSLTVAYDNSSTPSTARIAFTCREFGGQYAFNPTGTEVDFGPSGEDFELVFGEMKSLQTVTNDQGYSLIMTETETSGTYNFYMKSNYDNTILSATVTDEGGGSYSYQDNAIQVYEGTADQTFVLTAPL